MPNNRYQFIEEFNLVIFKYIIEYMCITHNFISYYNYV